jgi:hypothetical protein
MQLRSFVTVLGLFVLGHAVRAQLMIVPMPPVSVCGDPVLSVDVTASTAYNVGNVFTVELSDASGSFASPVAIGSVVATGSTSVPCSFPVGIIGGAGHAIRVLSSDPAEIGDAYVLPITTVAPPNAGLNSTIAVCSNSGTLELLDLLGGIPNSGGAWSGPAGAVPTGLFDPAIDPPGLYLYVVPATAPCLLATANLFVVVNQAPNAGSGGTIEVCSGSAPFIMFSQLAGGAQTGGTWAGPGGAVGSGVYQPGVSTPGCYTYTVLGNMPCANASVALCIAEVASLSAGTNASVNWCQSFGPLDLMAELGGSPAVGGTWTDDNATGQLSGGFWDPTGMPSGTYAFTYSVGGSGCPVTTATVSVVHSGICMVPPQTMDPVE